MPAFRVEVLDRLGACDEGVRAEFLELGLGGVRGVISSRIFLLEGHIQRAQVERIGRELLADPVSERFELAESAADILSPAPGATAFEIHPRPGVMDTVAESTLAELRDAGFEIESVRTGRRYVVAGDLDEESLLAAVGRFLANDCIEEIVPGTAGVRPPPRPPHFEFKLRHVSIRALDDAALERLSREGHLFLSRAEMQAIQTHFCAQRREPTDLELETLAQTWSEHCVHKTLKSAIVYRGDAMPVTNEERRTQNAEGDRCDAQSQIQNPESRNSPEIPNPQSAVNLQSEFRNPQISAQSRSSPATEIRYENLLKDTIARATRELIAERRGPECLSVFVDNAGVIGFDADFGLAFKVETHNHPSAIEPYGGAATGVGGCIRDVIGCGLGARPIANTDVFCVAPGDWPHDKLPRGVLHPRRVLRGVVRGVADYGNRMGIPTINGAIHFDPRFLGNPLVYCGCLGLIPRDRIQKAARPGDLIVVIGGRTGRDGIHGATFSSAELTDSHADEFSHAVQIGNAITEKRVLDAVMRARGGGERDQGIEGSREQEIDGLRNQGIKGQAGEGAERWDGGGCLYSAITDCGAGGLSSAIGEMGADIGAAVDLEKTPLKYAGLRYDEIWISEAQERMVLAVPPENLPRLLEIMREEEVEATVLGTFGAGNAAGARLIVRYNSVVVGDLDMRFLHDGVPRVTRQAEWCADDAATVANAPLGRVSEHADERLIRMHHARGGANAASAVTRQTKIQNPKSKIVDSLLARLSGPTVASKEWVVRKYDHEVQGGSVVKPLCGRGDGPADAAVLRPRLDSHRGVALGCGLAPHLSDVDPYWMAAAAIDEAVRNVVCVGADPNQTAMLDNFCCGRTDDPRQLGALVRACQACYDAAKAYGVPFISGKDSLNNEFALDAADVDPLLAAIASYAERDAAFPGLRAAFPAIAARIGRTQRLAIPPTLLISALALVGDVRRCVTSDVKNAGAPLFLVGGLPATGFSLHKAALIHRAVAKAIVDGHVATCHDVSDGGWLVAAAEMALAGRRGVEISTNAVQFGPFEMVVAGYLIEATGGDALKRALNGAGVPCSVIGRVRDDNVCHIDAETVTTSRLFSAWNP